MKKVGILTINDNNNYGNRLQNYAVQESLKKYNVEVQTIINTTSFKKQEKLTVKVFFKKCIGKAKHIYISIKQKKSLRKKCFDEFNKNIDFFDKIINKDNIDSDINKEFDTFFTGSDQVWNPTFYRMSDIDFLTFASEEKRNSFSASFGISVIPEELKGYYSENLKKFKNISVREERGKELIEELIDRRDIEILIDPTMNLSKDDWKKVSKKPKQLKNKKYILNYFLGNLSDSRKKEIDRIAKENNCEVINILDEKSPFYQTGPSEFLYLEENAFLICTDSFHSCIFAIIFDKPFIVFEREDNTSNMNSRIETLLNKFKLENRKFNRNITAENLKHDYKQVYRILDEEKRKLDIYLRKALEI